MVSPISASLSGLQAASKRLDVSSKNIANQQSLGYEPQQVQQTSNNGVVQTKVQTVSNPTQKLYQPDNPASDEAGFIDAPNVDLASELVNLKVASYDYKANLKAIAVQNNVEQSLLDILS